MQILEMRTFSGPNIYSYKPAVLMRLNIGRFEEIPSTEIPGFVDNLLQAVPSLHTHECSRGYAGGFVERLREGTYLGHVVEHLALELQCLAGMSVGFGKARRGKKPGIYNVVFEYEVPEAGIIAGQGAVAIISSLIERRECRVSEWLQKVNQAVSIYGPGPSTKCLLEAARQRRIPVMRIGNGSLLQLGWGVHQERVQAAVTSKTSCISADIASDKWLTKQFLRELGIPVPSAEIVTAEHEAVEAARRLGGKVVVKPLNGNHGRGVSLNLTDQAEIRTACRLAQLHDEKVLVEQYIPGRDYRLLVVKNQVVAAAERVPAHVVGDGMHTIRELVDICNEDPNRGEGHEKPLTRIPIDPIAVMTLAKQGYTLDSVVPFGITVYLRETGNISTGGTAVDVTDIVHPQNKHLAIRAVGAIGLDVAGVDMVAIDISKPIDGTGACSKGAILEVNASPGLRMHHFPAKGEARDVAGMIINSLFPLDAKSRIPVITVTGTNGKTTTTRLISHMIERTGKRVGVATSDGIYIGGEKVVSGDTTGPWSTRVVLRDPSVEVAVLEVARGGILRSGLAYDYSDIAVITNVSEDHLGQDDIDTLEEMADVKSLVAECVKREGYVVLNANDPLVAAMKDKCAAMVIYFSIDAKNPCVEEVTHNGGWAVIMEDDRIISVRNNRKTPVMRVKDVALCLGGVARHNIENCLAAVAAALAAGVPKEVIRKSLLEFALDPAQNSGRFQRISCRGIDIVIDYAHNKAAYRVLTETIGRLYGGRRTVGVIGMPGDRKNEDILEVGRIAGQCFDRLLIKEDADLRGREPGEVAHILKKGALSGGADENSISLFSEEGEAVREALRAASPGEVVVVTYEKLDKVLGQIREWLGSDPNHVKEHAQEDFPGVR